MSEQSEQGNIPDLGGGPALAGCLFVLAGLSVLVVLAVAIWALR